MHPTRYGRGRGRRSASAAEAASAEPAFDPATLPSIDSIAAGQRHSRLSAIRRTGGIDQSRTAPRMDDRPRDSRFHRHCREPVGFHRSDRDAGLRPALKPGDDIAQLVAQAMGNAGQRPNGPSRQYDFDDRRGVVSSDSAPRYGKTSSIWCATQKSRPKRIRAKRQIRKRQCRTCCAAAC